MKYTKGNWKIGVRSSCVVTDDKDAVDLEKRDTPESIEYYGGALIAESCRKDDAKLIAAAPDLLAALKEIYSFTLQPGGRYLDIILNECAKAIKKATPTRPAMKTTEQQLKDQLFELINWLEKECPSVAPPLEPYDNSDLSHNFTELLRIRLDEIYILRERWIAQLKEREGKTVRHKIEVYSRPECPFNYCDNPEECKKLNKCRHT